MKRLIAFNKVKDLRGLSIEPRDYQLQIVGEAVDYFAGGMQQNRQPFARHRQQLGRSIASRRKRTGRSVLIESPTGSGKTIMGLLVARHLQRSLGCRVGWVAMRRNLLEQAGEENRRSGFGVELRPISMFDKHAPTVDLLVIDEAQHDAARTMATLHASIQPKWVLGLSATPYRSDRVGLCFEKVLREAGIRRLIHDGYLSPFQHYTIHEYDPPTVVETYCREPERWGRTLIFFHRLSQCRETCELLQGRGVTCDVVTAMTDRQRQIADFEAGRVQVLLSMMILCEGFNCPLLETVFCRPSGRSCTVQMAGRVLRKHPVREVKRIVQCRQTRHPFSKTAEPTEQYVWSGQGWQSLKPNRQIASMGGNILRVIAESSVSLPAFLARRRAGPTRPRFDAPGDSAEPAAPRGG